jgi:hypothetical protein
MVCILQLIFAFIFFSLEFFLFLLLNLISFFPLFDCFSSMRKQAKNPHFFHFEAKQFSLPFRPFRFGTDNKRRTLLQCHQEGLIPCHQVQHFVLWISRTCMFSPSTSRVSILSKEPKQTDLFRDKPKQTPKQMYSTNTGTALAGLVDRHVQVQHRLL